MVTPEQIIACLRTTATSYTFYAGSLPEHSFATNTRMAIYTLDPAVKFPVIEEICNGAEGKKRLDDAVANMLSDCMAITAWTELVNVQLQTEKTSCKECQGTGKKITTCPVCDGQGQVECDECAEHGCDHEHDCDKCDGLGYTKDGSVGCITCSGSGSVDKYKPVEFGKHLIDGISRPVYIDGAFYLLLKELGYPDCPVMINFSLSRTAMFDVVFFRARDYVGVIVPVSKSGK